MGQRSENDQNFFKGNIIFEMSIKYSRTLGNMCLELMGYGPASEIYIGSHQYIDGM